MMNIMAPSRGLTAVFHQHAQFSYISRRSVSDFSRIATDPNRKVQAYISRSFDPYVNLSIEHFLLQKSPPESIILFLYTNKPCIVIGRNQNPWVEVNLGLLKKGLGEAEIHLVRRRSGGGAVFHDEGNVNYSVICPTAVFDRDKHAQMVVKALHGLGIKEAKVNERHDIILEAIPKENDIAVMPGSDDAEGQAESAAFKKPFKISGSAYKLTRLRSLHHGTCLLSSPNIKQISKYLRSPAKPYILARGVDSVSSPVANVNVANHAFEQAVVKEFCKMYSLVEPIIVSGEEVEVPEVAKGLAEIKVCCFSHNYPFNC
jgi:lipoate-protein ligase A